MKEEERTLEDRILAIAFLILCFGLGFLTRSQDIGVYNDFIGFPLSYHILDALVQIIMVGSLCMVLMGMILLQFDKTKE